MVDTSLDNKFSVFVPMDIIEKSGKDGKTEMVIKGVASTRHKDTDDEILEPDGFDVSKFLKSGFLNYNHLASKDPSMIIGEPTKAVAKNGELYIEGVLYEDSEMAQKVYQTAKVLKKGSKTRSFGFSIEGKALERDPFNPKRITKASITGCAITPSPKNPGTNMLVKGGIDAMDFSPEDGSEFLIDVTDEDGTRITVDKNFRIEKSDVSADISKAEGTQEASTAEESDGVTQKSSILADKKKKKKTEQDKKTFSKAETYEQIFSMFNCNVEDAPHLYKVIEKIQYVLTPDMEKVQITKDAILKAQEILGLVKSENTTPVVDEAAEAAKKEELKKAEIEKQISDLLKKAEELKAELGSGSVQKVEKPAAEIVKSESAPVADESAIIKAMNEKFTAIGQLIQSKDEQFELIKGENAELKKSIATVNEFNTILAKRLNLVAQQPMDRKAVTTTAFIEKGENSGAGVNGNAAPSNLVTLSLSNKAQREQLANELFKAATQNPEKIDDLFAKAVRTVELGSLGGNESESQRLRSRIASELKINVVK